MRHWNHDDIDYAVGTLFFKEGCRHDMDSYACFYMLVVISLSLFRTFMRFHLNPTIFMATTYLNLLLYIMAAHSKS